MRTQFFFTLLLLCQTVTLPAQTKSWNVQTYGFFTHYHLAIAYQPGTGGGFTVGHRFHKNWLFGAAGFEYTATRQELTLVGGQQEARANFYHSLIALRGYWIIKKNWATGFVSLLSGCSLLRPQPLTIDAGTAGRVTLYPKSETKFVAAWSSGCTFRIVQEMAVLLVLKQNFSRFANRQLEALPARNAWRSYWNFGAGLSWNF
ncbi:MAG: hypothetical protein ALAOOOJD_00611 [bacterium]|nr:hypothetical protein [bacterium]